MGDPRGSASGLRQGAALHPRRVFDPLDTLLAIQLVALSCNFRVFIQETDKSTTDNPKSGGAEGVQRAIGKPSGSRSKAHYANEINYATRGRQSAGSSA